jgi:type IV pilus assembly protein PilA
MSHISWSKICSIPVIPDLPARRSFSEGWDPESIKQLIYKYMKKLKSSISNLQSKNAGFTLIEILVVIGIIAILAVIVLIAINPAKQFAQSRNTQRTSNVNAVLNAVGQRMADNKGAFRSTTDTTCLSAMDYTIASGTVYTIKAGGGAGNIDLRPCLVPTYISEMSVDPKDGIPCADATCSAGYNTEYTITAGANGRTTVCAPKAVNENSIPGATTICITR